MDRDSLILVLVPRSSSLPGRRASFLRSAFSVPSRIARFEGVDQPGDWGEDRSSTTAFGYRDLEPSLPLTRNGNDTGKAHRHHHRGVCRPQRAGTTDRESLRRCIRPIRHYVRGRASTPTRAYRPGARLRPQNTDALRSDCPASRANRFSCYANIVSTSGAWLFLNRPAET
jgi:hypothetical protein